MTDTRTLVDTIIEWLETRSNDEYENDHRARLHHGYDYDGFHAGRSSAFEEAANFIRDLDRNPSNT